MSEVLHRLLTELKTPIELLNLVSGALFFGRFLIQWLASEKKKESVIPAAFWWILIAASVIALTYGVFKPAPSIVIQQLAANVVYGRNLVLVRRARKRLGAETANR